MEGATLGRMQCARHLAAQDDPFALGARGGHRNGGKERPGIGMPWISEYRLAFSDLDNSAEMHHGDAIGNVPHHGEVVRNENVGKAKSSLQVAQQIEHLRADRNIKRGHRLIADDELRLDRKRARDRNTLALTAREFMRIKPRRARLKPDKPQKLAHALGAM